MSAAPTPTDGIVKDLAEACSTQAKIENRAWLGIIAVSVVLFLPPAPSAAGCPPGVLVPFLGVVPDSVLSPLAFAMLAILIVALAAAHAQHIRADSLSHRIIDGVATTGLVAPRDLFDILRVPSFTRVAPLPQWIRGNWQWASENTVCPMWRRIAGTSLYILLKLVALAVLFATPGIAIWIGYGRVTSSSLPEPWVAILGAVRIIAIVSLILVTVADGVVTWPRIKKFAAKYWQPAT